MTFLVMYTLFWPVNHEARYVNWYLKKSIIRGVKHLLMLFQNVIFYYRYKEKIWTLTKTVEDIKGSKNQAADENIKGLQKKIGSLESELRNATTE